MLDLYVLGKDGVPVHEPNHFRWARWFGTADRQVARSTIGDIDVSTVFLGVDHSFGMGPPSAPVLWETMTFYDGSAVSCHRCAGTITAARGLHERVCGFVRSGEILPWGEDTTADERRPQS